MPPASDGSLPEIPVSDTPAGEVAAREPGQSWLSWLREHEDYDDQVAAASFIPPRRGEHGAVGGHDGDLLKRLDITPWRHQAVALELAAAGSDVVVSTPTASGKSLCFQVPLLATLERGGTAIYLAPTKALAHDQLGRMRDLAATAGVAGPMVAYDGDTPASERREARRGALCLVTNPDMLHYGILAFHPAWARFLGGLDLVVLDELHAYRGVLGAHVANILRRLLRIAAHYGADPRVIGASATIGNAAAHMESLTGRPAAAVTEDHAPAGERELVFWRPALMPGRDGRRRSASSEAAALAARFARTGVRSLFFCNSRKSAELLRRYASEKLPGAIAPSVQSYRAGYTAEDRRLIERAFRDGDITVLTATSALELGMDIGDVDAVVLVGWPGSHMALWQRFGRAGRKGRRALGVLIPGADPLDEYYLNHPDLVVEGRVEDASADAFNSVIHPLHLACAAAELPLDPAEEIVAPWCRLVDVPGVQESGGRWVSLGRRPHRRVSVRGTGVGRVRLVDGFGNLIGETGAGDALREVHPGAVYLHQGTSWLVATLDLDEGRAVLLPHIEDWYTQPRSETDISILGLEEKHGFGALLRVQVTDTVTGYAVRRHYSDSTLDERLLDLPPASYPTQALLLPCGHVAAAVAPSLLPSALHALEHTLIGLLPAFVLCERADVGGVSYPAYGPDGEPVIFIYDGYPGGVGYVRAGTRHFGAWLTAARDRLRDCSCRSGCPRCVLSPKCGNGNQYLDRPAALALAEALLQVVTGS